MFTIAIIGRPNVGKSTLFNRLAKKNLAIVDDTPGVTRDWREAEGYLLDHKVRIIDTAGLEESYDDSIEGRMRKQTEEGLAEADAVLFLIDGRSGVTPADEHFAGWLRKQRGKKKPVVLAVNKCESEAATTAGLAEAYSLGFGQPIPISSAHGHGIEDLYHAFKPHFPEEFEEQEHENDQLPDLENLDELEGDESFDFAAIEIEEDPEKPIKIAIVGRPNVGKSTLVNALLNEHRVMTGPEAGITRDAIAIDWEYGDKKIRLVDTAGMRKKAKIDHNIEKMSVEDSLRAIRLAQVCILVIDAENIFEKQDLQIADHILKEGRAMIIAINKWDLIKGEEAKKETLALINYKLETSLGQSVLDTYQLWNKRVSTSKLNRWMHARESQNPAPLYEGRSNRLKYMSQINIRPPTFAIWVSRPKEFPETYKRVFAKYAILAVSLVAVLGQFGIQTASLLAVLGAAGLAIGLALQGTLSNVAAGAMLLILRPFKVGDYIEFGSAGGTVSSLGLFGTELTTPDNKYVFAPNSSVWGNEITNYTKNKQRRQDIAVGISYDSDINKAMKTIEKVIAKEKRLITTTGKEPMIAVANMGESSVDLKLRIWTTTDDFFTVQWDLIKAIKEALDTDGISIPFPTRTLEIVNPEALKG
ncbi:unnamed protein product [Cyprideis torosa]|uniref:GTPase Der n=1 Tax=Cyprideis torosa TaxID=163714 RepID=A0A7R8ZNJ1_9CRUS|nr:unnamed protein product [Cyprideis torosa]CAG0891694.1 unnamed protein product [Cyprideis torosa]